MTSKNQIRSSKRQRIYLDYAASTPVAKEVAEVMRPYFTEYFGNPGSTHYFGQKAQAAIDRSREIIAGAIGAKFSEVIFTSSATEANNLALRGSIKAARLFSDGTGRPLAPAASGGLDSRADDSRFTRNQSHRRSETFRTKTTAPPYRVIISSIEHESVLDTAKDLEREGVEVIYLPVCKEGFVDIESLKRNLTKNTVLVSVIFASNEIGTIQPITKIAKVISEFKIKNLEFNKKNNPKSYILNPIFYPLFHTDAVQAFQFLDCDVHNLGVDLMTLSAQKIYGPKGVGALYIKNLEFRNQNLGIKNKNLLNPKSYILSPLITGGGQEYGLRSGTENVPAIVGFSKAVELIQKNKNKEAKRVKKLRDYFWCKLHRANPELELNGPPASSPLRLPNNLNIYFPGHDSQDLLIKFDLNGISLSAGSACLARSTEASHVIEALNLGKGRAKSSLRISLGRPTDKKQVDIALKRVINLLV